MLISSITRHLWPLNYVPLINHKRTRDCASSILENQTLFMMTARFRSCVFKSDWRQPSSRENHRDNPRRRDLDIYRYSQYDIAKFSMPSSDKATPRYISSTRVLFQTSKQRLRNVSRKRECSEWSDDCEAHSTKEKCLHACEIERCIRCALGTAARRR